mmetsp:Transcript_4182/g.5826  ORF Transcript_4182/g.5826 Transcript_4182/m.5826 type:complete len:548 (+) Transcript_4182:42-1685(+)
MSKNNLEMNQYPIKKNKLSEKKCLNLSEPDSEEDELLNYVVNFTPKKKPIKSSATDGNNSKPCVKIHPSLRNNTHNFTDQHSAPNLKFHKRGECDRNVKVEPLKQSKSSVIEKAAALIVKNAIIPSVINDPSTLYWQKTNKRGTVLYLPCRECHVDEALGLDLPQKWDVQHKVLVQFIEGSNFTNRALVTRRLLFPFNQSDIHDQLKKSKLNVKGRRKSLKGKKNVVKKSEENHTEVKNDLQPIENKDQWCVATINELERRRRKEKKFDDLQIYAEKLFLQRVASCAHSRQKQAQGEEQKAIDSKMEVPQTNDLVGIEKHCNEEEDRSNQPSDLKIVSQYSQHEEEQHRTSDVDLDNSDDNILRFSGSNPKLKSECIRPGDMIAYYSSQGVVGDKTAYREAKVLSVDRRRRPILFLDTGDFISDTDLVRRIKIIFRNKMVDYRDKGKFQALEHYRLNTAEIHSEPDFISRETCRLGSIIEKKTNELRKRVKESGYGDCVHLLTNNRGDSKQEISRLSNEALSTKYLIKANQSKHDNNPRTKKKIKKS